MKMKQQSNKSYEVIGYLNTSNIYFHKEYDHV